MLSNLFTPFTIKHITLRNRVVMPPMVRLAADMPRELTDTDGAITDAVVEHYRLRAAAGTAMIIVEATAVDQGGQVWQQGLRAYADEHIPGLARLAEAIHAEGAVAAIQLVHGGPQAKPEVTGCENVGPSAIPPSEGAPTPRALTVEEIQAIEGRFADAASRAIEANFDVVELHGAHGYLLDSFLMQERNQRQDAYGGPLAGRMRFLVETCQRVKARIGPRALLDCRISVFNKREDFTGSDLIELVQGLEQAGMDLLHLSTNGGLKTVFGTDRTVGQWARQATRLPILVAGRLGNPPDAERAIAEGHTDLVAVGSVMLRDPQWTLHAQQALESNS